MRKCIEVWKNLVAKMETSLNKQEEGLRVAKSIDAKVGSFARAEEEIKRLREEFQQLKQGLREAGIKV